MGLGAAGRTPALKSFDPPDLGKELHNLLLDVFAVLLGHNVTASGTIPKLFRVSDG